MTRRQSNNQSSGDIAAHPAPKKIRVQKSAGKVLASIFWDQERALSSLSSKRLNYQRGVLLISVGATEGHLKENAAGKSPRGSYFLHDKAPAHRELATQKKLAYLGFQCLDHPPYCPDLAPSDYHLFPGLKKHFKGRHFSSDAEVTDAVESRLQGQPSELLWGGLQKLEQRAKKCTELRGEYVE